MGRHVLGIVGAGIGLFVMMIGFKGAPSGGDGATWSAFVVLSPIFGVAVARGFDD